MRGVVVFAVLGLLAPAASAPVGAEDSEARTVYMDKCVACHGATGAPTPPFAKRGVKDLSDPEWQASQTDDEIRASIADGSEGTLMRAFERELDDDQIDALVAFVRSLNRDSGS